MENEKVFTALVIMFHIKNELMVIQECINGIARGRISENRLNVLLNAEESTDMRMLNFDTKNENSIEIDNASFGDDQKEFIYAITENIKKGEFIAVVGEAASGKSTLLKAIAGEIERKKGNINLNGTVAYCDQNPWIFNDTVQENIM
jgi:ABC-type multidrug transport system fused ATPase/permease subunit